jgi:GntR family transcriptional repressor for pyruvate dehydrogenase complex
MIVPPNTHARHLEPHAARSRTGAKIPAEIGGRRVDQALRQIVALIHEGQLPPGSRLAGERQLATLVGVSRPILREALNRLEARGLIDRRSKSGNYVCTAVPHEISGVAGQQADERLISLADVVDLRRVLEDWAVGRAAEAPSREALADLRALLATMKAAADFRRDGHFRRYQDADLAFHQAVARMAKNLLYVHLVDLFADLVKRAIAASQELVTEDFPRRNLQRQQAIFDAIAARDPARARAAMARHFDLLQERLPGSERRR